MSDHTYDLTDVYASLETDSPQNWEALGKIFKVDVSKLSLLKVPPGTNPTEEIINIAFCSNCNLTVNKDLMDALEKIERSDVCKILKDAKFQGKYIVFIFIFGSSET